MHSRRAGVFKLIVALAAANASGKTPFIIQDNTPSPGVYGGRILAVAKLFIKTTHMKSIFFCCILIMLLTGTACKKKDKGFLTLADLATIAKSDYIAQNKILIDKGYSIFNEEGLQYIKKIDKGKQRDDYMFIAFDSDTNTLMTYCTNSNAISEIYGQMQTPEVRKVAEQTYQYQSLYFTAHRGTIAKIECNCIAVHNKPPK